MGTSICLPFSATLLSPAAFLLLAALLSHVVLCVNVGSDFATHVGGFQLKDLEKERVCRPPAALPGALVKPLTPSVPPPAPYKGFTFDVALVIQRHGCRRSMMEDEISTPAYGNTRPGQLLPQGAYELHVAGIEMRRYLLNALGLWSSTSAPLESSSSSPEDTYKKTLGLDITDECRTANISSSLCTLSNLVHGVGNQIPPGAVYARSSALPRTQWSGLMFLEGFYGFPLFCAGTVEELEKTAGGRTETVCIRRSACDTSLEKMGYADSFREKCTSERLPCMHTAPVEEDGLMCGATVSKVAFADANAHYISKGVKREYEPKDPNLREALDIAVKIWGEKMLGKAGGWMAGEMAFSELGAGEKAPLAQLARWVEAQNSKCQDSAGECSQTKVRSYESLLADMLTNFREGTNVAYADGNFSRYVASPFIALQNAVFRVKAFDRNEDWKHLQEVLYLLGGFEDLKQEAAVEKLKMLLLSFHDFLLLSVLELLDIHDGKLLPFAARLTIELSHAEAEAGLRGTRTTTGDSGCDKSSGGCTSESKTGDSKVELRLPEQCSWPRSSHFVRLLVGVPHRKMLPVRLPWCENAVACPLHVWLQYTYEKVKEHWFFDVASNFRQKYARAHTADVAGPARTAQ